MGEGLHLTSQHKVNERLANTILSTATTEVSKTVSSIKIYLYTAYNLRNAVAFFFNTLVRVVKKYFITNLIIV